MDALLRKFAVALIRNSAPNAGRRRPATRPGLACDALEGRRLLAAGLMSGASGMMHARGHGAADVSGLGRDHRGLGDDWATPATATLTTASATPGSPTDTATTTAITAPVSTAATPTYMTPTSMTWGPDQGTRPTTAGTTAAPPTPTTQAKTDLQALRAATQAVQAGSGVTMAQLDTFRQDLDALHKDATTAPSQAAVTAIQADLTALQGTLPTAAQTAQLEADYTTLLTGEGITDTTLIQKSIADQVAIASASNVTQTELDAIAADQKAVATDLGVTAPTTTVPTSTTAPKGAPGMGGEIDILGGLTGGALGGPGGAMGGAGGGFGRPGGGRFGA